jgi:hypothetical protein
MHRVRLAGIPLFWVFAALFMVGDIRAIIPAGRALRKTSGHLAPVAL